MHYVNLDNKTKKTIIRFSLYGILGVLIAFLTVILTLVVQGYDIDRKTGKVIQNGLLLIDSLPEDANVEVNGLDEGKKTPTRLPVPEGQYNVKLSLDGYNDWTRSFNLFGSEVIWLDYPIFVPNNLRTVPINSFNKLSFAEMSGDKKYIVTASNNGQPELTLFRVDNSKNILPETVEIPSNQIRLVNGSAGKLSFVEWAPNNKHILIKHENANTLEFIWLDVTKPQDAVNLTQSFSRQFEKVKFTNKFDQLVSVNNSTLRRINVADKNISNVFARDVVELQTTNSDDVYFVSSKSGEKRHVLSVLDGQEVNRIFVLNQNISNLDYREYDSDKYLAFKRGLNDVVLYRDLNHSQTADNVPEKVFNENSINDLEFSRRGRFLMARSNQRVHVFDIELTRDYTYGLPNKAKLSTLEWLDEHHLTYVENNRFVLMDFDGSNRYRIASVNPAFPIHINDKKDRLFSVGVANATKASILQRTELLIAE